MTHWQHRPHQAPAMVSEFTITHQGGRTTADSSYTFECPRADCKGVPPGLTCECAKPR